VHKVDPGAQLVTHTSNEAIAVLMTSSAGRSWSIKLTAFLNGHRHFFWRPQVLLWRFKPDLFGVPLSECNAN
jgi:hypothetical protein